MPRKYLACTLLLMILVAGCGATTAPAQPTTQPSSQPATQPTTQPTTNPTDSYDYGSPQPTPPPAQTTPTPAQPTPPPGQTTPAAGQNTTTPAPPPPAAQPGVVEITVKLSEYNFDPGTITVAKGSQVKLTIVNEGTRSHDMEIATVGLKSEVLAAGKNQVLTFTADKVGEFQIICTQRGHREKGMTATMVVK